MSSRHCRKSGRSLCGRPMSARKIVDGSGVAKSSWNSHSPRVGEAVDDLVHELARFGLELRPSAWARTRGSSRRRYLRVLGRVDRQRDAAARRCRCSRRPSTRTPRGAAAPSARRRSSRACTLCPPNMPAPRCTGHCACTSWYTVCGSSAQRCENRSAIDVVVRRRASSVGVASAYIRPPWMLAWTVSVSRPDAQHGAGRRAGVGAVADDLGAVHEHVLHAAATRRRCGSRRRAGRRRCARRSGRRSPGRSTRGRRARPRRCGRDRAAP